MTDMWGIVTTIRTTCPRCGAVEMTADAILLSVREVTGEGSYRFLCPACMEEVEKPADRKIVALLLSAGVDMAEPDEDEDYGESAASLGPETHPSRWAAELEPRPAGAALTTDDIISFHFLLMDDEALLRELTASE